MAAASSQTWGQWLNFLMSGGSQSPHAVVLDGSVACPRPCSGVFDLDALVCLTSSQQRG